MKNIHELALTVPEEHEIFIMPDVRIIGIARKCAFEDDSAGISTHDDYWNEFFAFKVVIDRLPLAIKNSAVCWTGLITGIYQRLTQRKAYTEISGI